MELGEGGWAQKSVYEYEYIVPSFDTQGNIEHDTCIDRPPQ
mgnify:CR=1 FL=1